MNLRTIGAILQKDLRSLYPLVLLTALLFAGDVLLQRVEWIPVWYMFRVPLLMLGASVLVLAVFQTDTAASLVDDWLCRPVPRAELLTAKLALVLAALYGSRVLATLVIDPLLGASLTETLQEAFLLQDAMAVFVLAVLLFIALVTRSVIQGIGVLLGILIAVFVIPTPLVSATGPLEPAIGEALIGVGFGWLAFTPATVTAIVLFAFGCWLVYWRREIRAARVLLGVSVTLMLALVLAPMWLMKWQPVFAAQTTLAPAAAPDAPVDAEAIYLRHPSACFPATRKADLASDSAFAAALKASGVWAWTDENIADSGPDSVAFLTSIEPRQVPPDWRLRLNYAEAEFHANGSLLYSLRPTAYDAGNTSWRLPHAWVLPPEAVRRLSGEPQVELKLRYYLTLLEPHPFDLPLDGRSHAVPALGHCSARRDASGGHIEVDCFTGLDSPVQISAELARIPASRVYGPPDFSPRWTRWPFGTRQPLTIGSPRLSDADHVTVTAWTVANYLEKSLVLPGILGDDSRTCPLPTRDGRPFQRALWRDLAKHEVSSIGVDEGVQLEVLDFGGTGSPILLLPGLGATAHSFDDLAPLLARKHRVLAITRRGFGYSSKPDFGFDTARLSRDVLQVMDALELKKVLLIGHSIAGDELTWLGGHHPERFSGLVYLDAAYDRSEAAIRDKRLRELNGSLPPEPPVPPEAFLNYEAAMKVLEQRGHTRLPEGELIAFLRADQPYLAGTPGMDARVPQAIMAALEAPDYAKVEIPALALYAFANPGWPLPPWYDASDELLKTRVADIRGIREAQQRANIEQFRRGMKKGVALEIPNATHFVFQSNQREVLGAIEQFAAQVGAN